MKRIEGCRQFQAATADIEWSRPYVNFHILEKGFSGFVKYLIFHHHFACHDQAASLLSTFGQVALDQQQIQPLLFLRWL